MQQDQVSRRTWNDMRGPEVEPVAALGAMFGVVDWRADILMTLRWSQALLLDQKRNSVGCILWL